MTLEPLLAAGPIVYTHAFAAIAAAVLGVIQVAAPKGTLPHRSLGYVWAGLMVWTAGSSLFIHGIRMIGPFSPIHILSVVTLIGVPMAVWAARRGEIRRHAKAMKGYMIWAVLVAGIFTFYPGRLMYQVVVGPD
ncbi:DUF2306 domain-containing protein [Pannonibacter tanglangensis]|uniref:DUF2306 domain-containing protein n=1 Tax=Pannonibacter tanglangensis TaxID=2750084 RepID=A0ABW9ZCS7_9HYPH|nr:DUF2306 domain-containing protein [Pannonibacter sp. XCT-34]NBN62456.1 DUF2306 domain-containing protein [Pannonibacter sp. XCT-34]